MFFFSHHLSKAQKNKIVQAIHSAELESSGEIRVHLSYARNEDVSLKIAEAKFKELKMDQTELRNGVLLYMNPKSKKFALFGDQGIHDRVQQHFWDKLASNITTAIRSGSVVHGIEQAVHVIGLALKENFPLKTSDKNELPDDITESD